MRSRVDSILLLGLGVLLESDCRSRLWKFQIPIVPDPFFMVEIGARFSFETKEKDTSSYVRIEEVADTGIIYSCLRRLDAIPLCDLNVGKIELRMGSLEFSEGL